LVWEHRQRGTLFTKNKAQNGADKGSLYGSKQTEKCGSTSVGAMKQPEYIEGTKARENFEEGMKALFKFPKTKL
jgi:hypothetical protein